MFKLCIKNQKILGISCLEIQNFQFPKQQRKGFRISDPQRTHRRIPKFRSPKEHNEGFRIWSPKSTGKDSAFLTPYNDTQNDSEFLIQWHTKGCWISDLLQRHRKVFRISDPPKNTGEDSEFLISHWTGLPSYPSKNIVSRGIGISDRPKT